MKLSYDSYFRFATMQESSELFPLVTVDIALFTIEANQLRVLLVRRTNEPERLQWALPGGVLKPNVDQDLESAARRVLQSKVSAQVPFLEQVHAFSGRDRDPRGWSISVLFCALLPRNQIETVLRDKVDALDWADPSLADRELAFDHALLVEAALHVLRDRVAGDALPLHLLPDQFTLTDLQRTCQFILGRSLDKSVFRRRLRDSPDLLPIEGAFERGAQRPAQLYRARPGYRFLRRQSA